MTLVTSFDLDPINRIFLDWVIEAMNQADEIGGPEGGQYVKLMLEIAHEAMHRIDTCVAGTIEMNENS